MECFERRGRAPTAPRAACFTPVESPESNGVAEAFVKTFKRDYVRVNAIPDAQTALAAVSHWMNDYNRASEHPSVYVIEEKTFC